MSAQLYSVRRATVDDLPTLQALWAAMHIPAAGLEARLKEFQVVESDAGAILGALGLEVIERQGRLHSEAFADFALSAELREILWARMQSVAANYGLARVWTAETAPFWKQAGFRCAEPEILKRLPTTWAAIAPADWITLQLRDEVALQSSLDRDFEALRREAAQKTESALRMARFWNYFATGLAIVVAIVVIIFCASLLHHNTALIHR
jgi:N-acetylglutamate synthase-like GNAT family acetyltransferase